MLNKEVILEFLKVHYKKLQMDYHIIRIGIIGSFARDERSEQSDIDLLVEFERGTEDIYELKMRLKNYLKSHFNRDIDICREKYMKPYIREYLENEVIYV